MTWKTGETRTQWLIAYVLGPCTCGEAYSKRRLTSPLCQLCNDENELREALLLSYQFGHDEKDTELVESNRKSLTYLMDAMTKDDKP